MCEWDYRLRQSASGSLRCQRCFVGSHQCFLPAPGMPLTATGGEWPIAGKGKSTLTALVTDKVYSQKTKKKMPKKRAPAKKLEPAEKKKSTSVGKSCMTHFSLLLSLTIVARSSCSSSYSGSANERCGGPTRESFGVRTLRQQRPCSSYTSGHHRQSPYCQSARGRTRAERS